VRARGHHPVHRAALLAAAALALALAGCRDAGDPSPVAAGPLARELDALVTLKLQAQAVDDPEVNVTCTGEPGDRFSCRVDVVAPPGAARTWAEGVDCSPAGRVDERRCSSSSGYVLQ
jgi:hypothetical protein